MINWFDMPAEGLSNGGEFEIKELEVTENGTYEEKGEMYNKVIVNVEGDGGNPNTIQTVSGTLANPWGNIDVVKLYTALANKEATAYIDIDTASLGMGTVLSQPAANTKYYTIYINGADFGDDIVAAYNMTWKANGELLSAKMSMGGTITNITALGNSFPTVLTVVWHPLP